MRRYKYVGPRAGIELRSKGVSYVTDKDGIVSVPFKLERDDFEEIKSPAKKDGTKKTEEKS